MTSRERVTTALRGQEPDRIPIDLGGSFLTSAPVELQQSLAALLGLEGAPDPRFPYFNDLIQRRFGCDLRSLTPRQYPDWGFRDVHDAPLRMATVDDLDLYPWPEPDDGMVDGLAEYARFLHEETEYFICASQIGQGPFELGCYLRGYERILLDIGLDQAFVHTLNAKGLAVNQRLGDLYFGAVGPTWTWSSGETIWPRRTGPICPRRVSAPSTSRISPRISPRSSATVPGR